MKSSRSGKRAVGFSAAAWQEIAARWVDGMLRYTQEAGTLAFHDFSFLVNMETDALAPPPPWTGRADGVIIGFGLGDDEDAEEAMRWIERGGVPAVSLAWDWRHPRLPTVTTDLDAVMKAAADYLLRLGLQHFALLDDEFGGRHRDRRQYVFAKHLAKHGHEMMDLTLSFRAEGTREDLDRLAGEEQLKRALLEAPKPLGVYAVSDNQARVLCWLCEELGLEVPGEVAILGTGDLGISRRHSPTISTVRTSAEQVGYEAIKLLHRLMDGAELPARARRIGPENVIERESTCDVHRGTGDIRRAVEFIHRHACEGINVDDVVRHTRGSRRTLELQFATRLGHSPGQEIQNVRLAKAKQLLLETGLSVTKIAELTGFSEHARLTTFFRRHTGIPPSEFRKRVREGGEG